MQFKESFGCFIRKLREGKNLPIRKVAAHLDIDPSTLSKIERDERSANKDMIKKLAEVLEHDNEEMLMLFLSDKVMYDLIEESRAEEILRLAEQRIKYEKQKRLHQGKLNI